jgi:simple sugar transport system substrate-binding protein
MTPIDKNHVFLSSVLWDFTATYKQAIKDIEAGTYGTKGYDLNLKNGGIALLKTKYIPASVWAQINAARTKILSGAIKVPAASKAGQVNQLIK